MSCVLTVGPRDTSDVRALHQLLDLAVQGLNIIEARYGFFDDLVSVIS